MAAIGNICHLCDRNVRNFEWFLFESFKSQQLVIASVCRIKFKRSIINSCCGVHSFIWNFSRLPRRAPSCIDFILTLSIRRHNYYRHIESSHLFFASHCNIAVEIANSMVLLILLNSEIDWVAMAMLIVTPERDCTAWLWSYIFVNLQIFFRSQCEKHQNQQWASSNLPYVALANHQKRFEKLSRLFTFIIMGNCYFFPSLAPFQAMRSILWALGVRRWNDMCDSNR